MVNISDFSEAVRSGQQTDELASMFQVEFDASEAEIQKAHLEATSEVESARNEVLEAERQLRDAQDKLTKKQQSLAAATESLEDVQNTISRREQIGVKSRLKASQENLQNSIALLGWHQILTNLGMHSQASLDATEVSALPIVLWEMLTSQDDMGVFGVTKLSEDQFNVLADLGVTGRHTYNELIDQYQSAS